MKKYHIMILMWLCSLVWPHFAYAEITPHHNLSSEVLQQQREYLQQQQEQQGFQPYIAQSNIAPKIIWQNEQPCFQIENIDLRLADPLLNDTAFSTYQFRSVLKPLIQNPYQDKYALGKCIGNQNLKQIIDIAQNELLKQGYITSQVSVEPQDLSTGRLTLTIYLGRVNQILYQQKEAPFFIRQSLPIKQGDILNLNDIEQSLEYLKRIDSETDIKIQATQQNPIHQDVIGWSDLNFIMNKKYNIHGALNLDNSLHQNYGRYLLTAQMGMQNIFNANDDWSIMINFPLRRIWDYAQYDENKDQQLNYQIQFTMPFKKWKWQISHNKNRYHQYLAGLNQPLDYHGVSKQYHLGLTRLLLRDQNDKLEWYAKAYHKHSQHYIDEIEIAVQKRKTSGWHTGLLYQYRFKNQGSLYLNLDYRRGTGAFSALPAPEEQIYNAFGEKLPAEGYARSPIWSAYVDYTKPFQLGKQHLYYALRWQGQYAKKLPVAQDLFYIGGRYSVRGFADHETLAGEHGHSIQNTLTWVIPYLSQAHQSQLYLGVDTAWVQGAYSQHEQRQLIGSVFGLKHQFNRAYFDVAIGRGLHSPTWLNKNWVTSLNLGVQF